jgi:hypothetical protein
MTPTNKLRYIARYSFHGLFGLSAKKHLILQQWWEPTEWNAPGEWRNVPLEEEND